MNYLRDSMNDISKKLISFFLLLLFLAPLAVKVEHKHEDNHHPCAIGFGAVEKELSYQVSHEECPICQYEFLFLLTTGKDVEAQRITLNFDFLNNYTSILISGTEINSVPLRAPPIPIL